MNSWIKLQRWRLCIVITSNQQGWSGKLPQDSPEGSICVDSTSNAWEYLSHIQNTFNQEVKGSIHLVSPIVKPLGNVLLSFPMSLHSAGLEYLFWEWDMVIKCCIELETQTSWPLWFSDALKPKAKRSHSVWRGFDAN